MKKPEICFVSEKIYPVLNPAAGIRFIGGAELQQLFLGSELARRGYPVSYLTMNYGQPDVETLGPFTVYATFRPDAGVPLLRFFYPRLVQLWKALKKCSNDIFYVRSAGSILAVVTRFANRYQRKVVFCGASDTDFDPAAVRLDSVKDKKMYFWGLKHADAVVCQNRFQQDLLQKRFGMEGKIIFNGFPRWQGQIEQTGRNEILWVSNLRELKKPHSFLELARSFPREKFVMIIGRSKTSEVYEQKLRKKARGILNLEVLTFLPLEEVEKRFDHAKLLVNTSLVEGFPNTFLQAWKRGIPVLSFVDPDRLIATHQLGWVASSVAELKEHCADFLQGRLSWSAANIKQFFDENLSIEKITDVYEALFLDLINEQSSVE